MKTVNELIADAVAVERARCINIARACSFLDLPAKKMIDKAIDAMQLAAPNEKSHVGDCVHCHEEYRFCNSLARIEYKCCPNCEHVFPPKKEERL